MLNVIKRTIVYKTTYILLELYNSLVRPHLEYCISACSPHYNKDKQLLERIQHRFTCMLPGMKQLSYTQHLWKLGLWSLKARRYHSDLIEVYKMLHGKSAVNFSWFFELDESYRTHGHSFKLNVFKNGLHLLWKNDRLPMCLLWCTDLWFSEAKPIPSGEASTWWVLLPFIVPRVLGLCPMMQSANFMEILTRNSFKQLQCTRFHVRHD